MAYRLDPAQPCKRQDHREALFAIGEPTYSLFRLSLIYGNYIVDFTSFFLTPRIATPYELF